MSPTLGDFQVQLFALGILKTLDAVNVGGALSEQSSFTQQRQNLVQAIVVRKIVDILEESFAWNANKRIANLAFEIVRQVLNRLATASFIVKDGLATRLLLLLGYADAISTIGRAAW